MRSKKPWSGRSKLPAVVLTISPISTKQTINSHLNLLNTKKTMTYDVGNPGPGLGQAQKCGRVKQNNGIPTIMIIGSPTAIQI